MAGPTIHASQGSAKRNQGPVLEALTPHLSKPSTSRVLEIASGLGTHICSWANAFPHISFRPTEREKSLAQEINELVESEELENVSEARIFDVGNEAHWQRTVQEGRCDLVHVGNMLHATPWEVTEALFHNIRRLLIPEQGILTVYGPFRRGGGFLSESDKEFDAMLKAQDPTYGLRDIEEVESVARRNDLLLTETKAMPAGNFFLVFQLRQWA